MVSVKVSQVSNSFKKKEIVKKLKNYRRYLLKSDKFKNFVGSVKEIDKKKALIKLGEILFYLTILALINASALKTIGLAYKIVANNPAITPLGTKAYMIVKTYIGLLSKLKTIEKFDQIFTIFTLFVDTIPRLIKNKGVPKGKGELELFRDIFHNINRINKEYKK